MPRSLRFSIITKITMLLLCYITSVTVMGLVSYHDLSTTETKISILEQAYNIHNNVIESRRYEKNYFLYGHGESLNDSLAMIHKASAIADAIISDDSSLLIVPPLRTLKQSLGQYADRISALLTAPPQDDATATRAATAEEIRHYGKIISESSEAIVNLEKKQIHSLVSSLKEQLVSWSSIAILIGILFSALIISFIFKPLAAIKRATEAIAQGKFKKIEVMTTKDEMQRVMEAFNIMVQELERRQDQLIQAEKLSSLGTLTAGVAHQLNNPLNNISTSCQIAIDEFDAGDVPLLKRMLHNIDQETLRARDVVKSLLEFARTQDFTLRPTSMADIAQKSVLLAKSQIPPDIAVSIQVPPELVLPVDAQRMQEVFINMLINAAQAIRRQGQIRISAAEDPQAGEVVITISDSGEGISEKNLAKIFDPFFTTKAEGQGTGLGLSVVYGIIQQHHGTIAVQSTPGQGTSFAIHLPYPKTAEPRTPTA